MSTEEKIDKYLTEAKMSIDEKGVKLAEFLNLKKKGDKYNTSWGSKTAQGLWASVERFMKEVENQ